MLDRCVIKVTLFASMLQHLNNKVEQSSVKKCCIHGVADMLKQSPTILNQNIDDGLFDHGFR